MQVSSFDGQLLLVAIKFLIQQLIALFIASMNLNHYTLIILLKIIVLMNLSPLNQLIGPLPYEACLLHW